MQVLLATDLKRTPSLLQPSLFSFRDHFVFEELIGRSRLSEVRPRGCSCSCTCRPADPRPLMQVWRVRHKVTGDEYAVKKRVQTFKSHAHRDRSVCACSRAQHWAATC